MGIIYPNLVELHRFHPYSDCTMAEHAGVTEDLFLAVLRGEDDLTYSEFYRLSQLVNIPVSILCSPSVTMLDPGEPDHSMMAEEALSAAEDVLDFIETKWDRQLIDRFRTDFYAGRASYMQYLGAMEIVSQAQINRSVSLKHMRLRSRAKKASA